MMSPAKSIKFLAILFILFSLFGCQKFNKIKIKQLNNVLHFDFSAMGESIKADKKYLLYDIGVSKLNCSSNCVVWEMLRKEEYFDSNAYPLEASYVVYGETLEAMKSVVGPNDLSTGEYSVAANVSLVLDDKFIKSELFISKFRLIVSGEGEVILPDNKYEN